MGKHEPMTAKAIANKIKAKGLQKIKYYCEMCKKQCRDDNGFKCHIMSESHQRQALVVSENPEKFVSEFSKQFMDGFMYIVKTRYRTKRILANTVFQEYIKERDHIHLNGTRWTSLTEFAYWLAENNIVKVEESERGVLITYVDNDPETLRRQELDAKRSQKAKEAAEREQKEIERQRQASKLLYDKMDSRTNLEIKPIPIVKIPNPSEKNSNVGNSKNNSPPKVDTQAESIDTGEAKGTVEVPVFKVQAISLKTACTSNYRPPPPKRKITGQHQGRKKSKI